MCLDVHGDEALPYIFLAGNEVRCCELRVDSWVICLGC